MMDKRDALNNVLLIIAFVIAIALIYMLILKLTGNSPTDITILGWFVALLTTLQIVTISMLFSIKGSVGELKEFKKNAIKNISELNKNVSELNNKVFKKK